MRMRMSGIGWLSLVATAAVAAGSEVEGEVNYVGERWRAIDAIACPCDDGGTCVAIGAARFDRAAFRADCVVDSVAVHERQPEGARYLVLSIDSEGILRDVGAYGPAGGSNQSDESMLAAFTLNAFDAGHVAGTPEYADGDDRLALHFDTEVEAEIDSE